MNDNINRIYASNQLSYFQGLQPSQPVQTDNTFNDYEFLEKIRLSSIKTPPHQFFDPEHFKKKFFNETHINSESSNQSPPQTTSELSYQQIVQNLHENQLLQKIRKFGNEPSETGLNLTEAKIIDEFVCKNYSIWREKFPTYTPGTSFLNRVLIKIKKNQQNKLPRSLTVGLEVDVNSIPKIGLDGLPVMRVMVLCKKKMATSECPSLGPEHLQSKTVKVGPVGSGTYKTAKAVIDWVTGELFVELILADGTDGLGSAQKTMYKEFCYMKLLQGYKGIAKPGIIWNRTIKKVAGQDLIYQSCAYFMPRYKVDLLSYVKSTTNQFSYEEALKLYEGLVDALEALYETGTVYCDGKDSNSLIDSNGSLVIMDFGLSVSKNVYLEWAKNNELCDGTYDYLAPEIINAYGLQSATPDYCSYPHARDVWSFGFQCLNILAIGNNVLKDLVCQFTGSMGLLRNQIINGNNLLNKYIDLKDPQFALDVQVHSQAFYNIHEKERCNFYMQYETVIENMKNKKCVLDYVTIDFYLDSVFSKFSNALFEGQDQTERVKRKALITIARKMLCANPNNRIDSVNLKKELAVLISYKKGMELL